MAEDSEEEEKMNLEEEFHWLLQKEVHSILKQLHDLLEDCSNRFLPLNTATKVAVKSETFVLSNTNGTDGVKGVVTLAGDSICKADITLRVVSRGNNQIFKTSVREDVPWRIQQVQDAANHLQSTLDIISELDEDYEFGSGEEVAKLMDSIMDQIKKGQQRLLNPTLQTLEDTFYNKYTRSLTPPLPQDTLVTFYFQGAKLVLEVLRLHITPVPKMQKPTITHMHSRSKNIVEFGSMRFEVAHRMMVDSHVPWVGEVTTCLTFALQLCQSLKDKIQVFSTYWGSKLPPVR